MFSLCTSILYTAETVLISEELLNSLVSYINVRNQQIILFNPLKGKDVN